MKIFNLLALVGWVMTLALLLFNKLDPINSLVDKAIIASSIIYVSISAFGKILQDFINE